MKLDVEIGLGPGHIVLDGDPAPPPAKRGTATHFSAHVYCGQTAGWIKMPLGTKMGLGPGNIVLDGGPAPPKHPPNFQPISTMAEQSPISGTAELALVLRVTQCLTLQ